jgi:hypothetical protein
MRRTYCAVLVAAVAEVFVSTVFVGTNRAAPDHVGQRNRLKRRLASIWNWASARTALAFQHTEHDGLVRHLVCPTLAGVATTDNGFFHLDVARQGAVEIRLRHELPQLALHTPCGLVGAAQLPL